MSLTNLKSVKKQFEYYKSLGEKTFAQISDDDLFFEYNEHSNSIAVTVNHLWGNMLSRWTDFLTSDGEKEWRNRDQEFESIIKTKEELLDKWNEGWACVFNALDSVNEDNFDTKVYIRNQAHSIMDAALRQLAHYAYHIGQIVYVGRMLSKDWNSLTIPKGKSKEFNQAKFAKGKHDGHFTDDIK
ncbi:hypothetical protein BFP97_06930 [Roseivirga sp. 4D4]|uniref:DUF1572 family protein n=1 Tax=Roseivirga sp. 4D4 TaxID=1889784 RepID=UPI000853039F|nr:DUF1572 family protein [Roseivirga sp. 4D4]OEK01261.1 hypothetical protein BFP97_06930 [Roseivirga sp. 4D4]